MFDLVTHRPTGMGLSIMGENRWNCKPKHTRHCVTATERWQTRWGEIAYCWNLENNFISVTCVQLNLICQVTVKTSGRDNLNQIIFLTFELCSIHIRDRENYVFLNNIMNGIILAEVWKWKGVGISMGLNGNLLEGMGKSGFFFLTTVK